MKRWALLFLLVPAVAWAGNTYFNTGGGGGGSPQPTTTTGAFLSLCEGTANGSDCATIAAADNFTTAPPTYQYSPEGFIPGGLAGRGETLQVERIYIQDTDIAYVSGAANESLYMGHNFEERRVLNQLHTVEPWGRMHIPIDETWTLEKMSTRILWNSASINIGNSAGTGGTCRIQYCQSSTTDGSNCTDVGSGYITGAYIDVGPDSSPNCYLSRAMCEPKEAGVSWTRAPLVSTSTNQAWYQLKVVPEPLVAANCVKLNKVIVDLYFRKELN